MSLLDVLRDFVIPSEEKWFNASESEEAGEFISDFARKYAKDEVLIVAGEMDLAFYGRAKFVEAARYLFQKGVSVKILFGEKPVEELKDKNKELWGLVKERIVELYQAKERPMYHYICIDGKSLALEQIHNPTDRRPLFFMEKAGKYARQYKKDFYECINKLCPIQG